MKVYLVYCKYYDYDERGGGDMLLGVYPSMEKAVAARDSRVEADAERLRQIGSNIRQYVDEHNNPSIERFYKGEAYYDETYTIEEWEVE